MPCDEQPQASVDGTPDSVGLSFVDLLYALPVADIALRVGNTDLKGVTASGWTDTAVALTAITLGWVGHHNNRVRLSPEEKHRRRQTRFWDLRFPQFVVEVLIIVAYFALGARPALSNATAPTVLWKAEWLTVLFALYLVWDHLDISIARGHLPAEEDWYNHARTGRNVTFGFFVVLVIVLIVESMGSDRPHSVVLFDLLAIVFLYLYRVTQEHPCE
jgi:hypothetical protein